MIIAIDGPAGSGKSTVARSLAARLRFRYLDTGAMYRSVAWAALQRGIDPAEEEAVAAIARDARIEFEHAQESPAPTAVRIDGADVTAEIRTPRVDAAVSAVASLPDVRAAMVALQRAEGALGDAVVEGRDIGTVVFPDAELKVYLYASASERARRRHAEHVTRGQPMAAEDVAATMAARDSADSTRETAPLAVAVDAIEIDTTGMTIDEVVDAIATLAGEAAR